MAARQKSYNDIKRQLERIQSHPRANYRRTTAAQSTARQYMNRAHENAYYDTGRKYFMWSDRQQGVHYDYDLNKKQSREQYTGRSDASFFVSDAKRRNAIPQSVYAGSSRVRSGGISEVSKTLKNGEKVDFTNNHRFWNNQIEGFYKDNSGRMYANVYWQGDDTDGNEYVAVDKIDTPRGTVIPGESFFDGSRTRYVHGDLRVDRDSLRDAVDSYADSMMSQEELAWAKSELAKPKQQAQESRIGKRQITESRSRSDASRGRVQG